MVHCCFSLSQQHWTSWTELDWALPSPTLQWLFPFSDSHTFGTLQLFDNQPVVSAQSGLNTAERQLVTAIEVERVEKKIQIRVLLLMRLVLILAALFQLQQHYRYAPRSASSQLHRSSKASASNTAIQLKHCWNTTGVPVVNFSLVPPERIRIHEHQNACLKNIWGDFGSRVSQTELMGLAILALSLFFPCITA